MSTSSSDNDANRNAERTRPATATLTVDLTRVTSPPRPGTALITSLQPIDEEAAQRRGIDTKAI